MVSRDNRLKIFQFSQALALVLSVGRVTVADASDLYSLSLEELINVKVASASLLPTHQLEAGSSVDVVSETQWQRHGARRTLDAVAHLPATVVLPMHLGADALAIRGYGSVSAYIPTRMTCWPPKPVLKRNPCPSIGVPI
jgi:hypothetical protein